MGVIATEKPTIENDVRRRMVQSAAQLFGERGFAGAGLRDVVASSGAPRGSIYHHFPGGKAQLAQEAAQHAADAAARPAEVTSDPVSALHSYLDGWRAELRANDFRAGSALAAVATAPADVTGAREAAAAGYERWSNAFAEALRESGVRRKKAARLATLAVTAIEGAVVLCRARRDTAPLDDIGRELEAAIANAPRR
ncbi:MAG TPA: helix-turn-helix domain-containing protein [Solirubrobacteraceae bacterium]